MPVPLTQKRARLHRVAVQRSERPTPRMLDVSIEDRARVRDVKLARENHAVLSR